MPRQNNKAGSTSRRRAGAKPKPKRKPTDKPHAKRPSTPADVSRSSRVRSTSRGGRGR